MKGEKFVILCLLALSIIATIFSKPIVKPLGITNFTAKVLRFPLCTYYISRYPAYVQLVNTTNLTIGIAIEPYVFNFGKLPISKVFSSRKFIEVSNNLTKAVKVEILAFGTISRYLYFKPSSFILGPFSKKSVEVILNTSQAIPGNYSGEIVIISKGSRIGFLALC